MDFTHLGQVSGKARRASQWQRLVPPSTEKWKQISGRELVKYEGTLNFMQK